VGREDVSIKVLEQLENLQAALLSIFWAKYEVIFAIQQFLLNVHHFQF
jgi:hypothetical protein